MRLTLASLIFTTLLIGCDASDNTDTQAPQTSSEAKPTASDSKPSSEVTPQPQQKIVSQDDTPNSNDPLQQTPEEEAYLKKYNRYIGATNNLYGDVTSSLNTYSFRQSLGSYGTDEEGSSILSPEFRAQSIYDNSEPAPPTIKKRYIETLEETIVLEPAIAELDGPARAFIAQVKTLDSLLNKLELYHDRGSYLEDDYALAAASHPILLEAYANVIYAYEPYSAAVAILERKIALEGAKKLEKAGYIITAEMIYSLEAAKLILETSDYADTEYQDEIDPDFIRKQLAIFTKSLDRIIEESSDEDKLEHRAFNLQHSFEP